MIDEAYKEGIEKAEQHYKKEIAKLLKSYRKELKRIGNETKKDELFSNSFSWDSGQLNVLKLVVRDLEILLLK